MNDNRVGKSYEHNCYMHLSRKPHSGFTLAELLIALAILGVIATFTIPKILTAQTNGKYNAMAHEVASSIGSAYDIYAKTNTVSSSTKISDLTPYLNYIALDSSSGTTVHDHPSYGDHTCGATYTCVQLHNGGTIWWQASVSFGGTANTNYIYVNFDPNPAVTNSGDAVQIRLFYGGRVSSAGQTGQSDPSWFQW